MINKLFKFKFIRRFEIKSKTKW